MFDVKLKEHWLTKEARQRGIDEHILELVLRHSRNQGASLDKVISYSLLEAIDRGFLWAGSPEGHEFWDMIYNGNSVRPLSSNSITSMAAHVFFIDFKEFE